MRTAVRTVLSGLAGLWLSSAAVAETAPSQKDLDRIGQAADAYDKGDCDTTLRAARPAIDARDFKQLPPKLVAIAFDLVVSCEIGKGLNAQVREHVFRGTSIDDSSDFLWRMRFGIDLDDKKWTGAVETLEAMTQGRGAALNSVPVRWMWSLYRNLKTEPGLRDRFLKIAIDNSYQPSEPLRDNQGFRAEYARLRADADDLEAAREQLKSITRASELASLSLHAKLRGYWATAPDIRKALEQALDDNRNAAAQNPHLLEPIVTQGEILRKLGRPADALRALDAARAGFQTAGYFTDHDDRINWWWDARGRASTALGRYDDMVESFSKGSGIGEGGELNVSQVINLAQHQNQFGRGEAALKTLAAFDDPKRKSSPYGDMEMRFARVCARVAAGKGSENGADLDYLKAHDKDHPEALTDAYLCSGDLDGAAASFIKRLDDPERREGALLQLSDFDPPPSTEPQGLFERNLPIAKARADVQAAIERAGGTRRFNVQANEL